MNRETAAWTLAGWLGAALIAVLTIMLAFIGSTQQALIASRIADHSRVANLEKALADHIAGHNVCCNETEMKR
jgi:hypothetical protein